MATKTPLSEAHDRLTIKTIYLRDGRAVLSDQFDPMIPGQQLAVQFQFGTEIADMREAKREDGSLDHTLRYFFRAAMRYIVNPGTEQGQTDPNPEQVAATIEARFCAEYAISPDLSDPSKESVKVFGDLNVPYHVWPYWREYCQNAIQRCSLPHAMVPMLRVDGKAPPEPQKPANKAEPKPAKNRTKRSTY